MSYGLSVISANVAYTLSTVWGKDKANFTFVDWGTVAANTGFSWGYGGLYLVDGQLDSPDPGCGVQVTAMLCLGSVMRPSIPGPLCSSGQHTPGQPSQYILQCDLSSAQHQP